MVTSSSRAEMAQQGRRERGAASAKPSRVLLAMLATLFATVHLGLALVLGLVLKEVPFLLWNVAAQLRPVAQATQLRQALLTGQAMGYAPASVWWRVLWPQLLPRLAEVVGHALDGLEVPGARDLLHAAPRRPGDRARHARAHLMLDPKWLRNLVSEVGRENLEEKIVYK